MAKRDKGEPESGIRYLAAGLVSLGIIFTFNHYMLSELHGKFFDPIYPAKKYLYFLATPFFIKFLYLGILFLIPHDSSK